MCGILGVYHCDGSRVEPEVVRRMMDIQRHRGPDDQGARLFSLRRSEAESWVAGTAWPKSGDFEGAVGFNRLSILDLSH